MPLAGRKFYNKAAHALAERGLEHRQVPIVYFRGRDLLRHEIYEQALARSYDLSFHCYATVSSTCDYLRSI